MPYDSVLSRDLQNMVMVYMVKRKNLERIETEPPGLNFELDDTDHMKTMVGKKVSEAYVYDYYNDILQISFANGREFLHFVACDASPEVIAKDNSIITVSEGEDGLLRDAAMYVSSVHREIDHRVMHGSVFAGWKIRDWIWPLIVNKCFRYNVILPESLVSDPMRNFQAVDYLLSVDQIYQQGVRYGRSLPALEDALVYWGYGERSKYPGVKTLNNAICTDPVDAAKQAETYMIDMRRAVYDYYGVGDRNK